MKPFTARVLAISLAVFPWSFGSAWGEPLGLNSILSVSGSHLGMEVSDLVDKGFRPERFQGETYYHKPISKKDMWAYSPDLAHASAKVFSMSGKQRAYWLQFTAEWYRPTNANEKACRQLATDFGNLLYGNASGATASQAVTGQPITETVGQIETVFATHVLIPALAVQADISCVKRTSANGDFLRTSATIIDTKAERSKIAEEISNDARLRLSPAIR